MGRKRTEGAAFKDAARQSGADTAVELNPGDADYDTKCEVCGELPTCHPTKLCGPCCFGEADTAGGNWL